jgi:NAD(P)-dependent dehydrogenase (short-subunit alcohol dehydrogenase family)
VTAGQGAVAVVAGGAGRLGRSVARGLVQDGHRVLVVDRTPVAEQSDHLIGAVADLTDEARVRQVVTDCTRRWAAPRVLVNCQGWSPKGGDGRVTGPAELAADDFMEVVRVNLLSCYLTMRAVVPVMADSGGGRVVNVSSTSGLTGRTTASAAYAAAKAGIDALTRTFAAAYGRRGVLVTAVAPGKFRNPEWPDDPASVSRYVTEVPLDRLAEAEDIGEFIRFLVSSRNNYITGHTMVVDGGRLA